LLRSFDADTDALLANDVIPDATDDASPHCHGRACPGHPRLQGCHVVKTWMPGIKPGMTIRAWRCPVYSAFV